MSERVFYKAILAAAMVGVAAACTPVAADVNDSKGTDGPKVADRDNDGVADEDDNCEAISNPDQIDVDADDIGDACDSLVDQDDDGVGDDVDNCLLVDNADQADLDMDGFGDVCDNCPREQNTDQRDEDADGIGDACPCDLCGATEWCSVHPTQGATCMQDCPNDRQAADQQCCPVGSEASAQGDCPLSDLYVDEDRLRSSLELDTGNFTANSCEFIEGCVQDTGTRTLLKFDTTTPNQGAGDLHLGDPAAFDNFVWSPCHNHYHFESYAAYEVIDQAGNVVAPGHKQAFCLMDYEPWGSNEGAEYNCGWQGISAGWADTYGSYLDCQFVDITDVPDGNYSLKILVNHEELIAEEDYSNNTLEIDFTLPL